MTTEAARAAALISSRLDYRNSSLYGLPLPDTVATAAERHRTTDHWHATSRSHHVGTTRAPLAVNQRACQFQSGMLGSPVVVRPVTCLPDRWLLPRVWERSARSLRSADVQTCVVPQTHSSYGDTTLAAAGPRLWNSLPVQLRNPDITYRLFRRQLKGHLLGNYGHGALWLLICNALEKYLLTYLLNHNLSYPPISEI